MKVSNPLTIIAIFAGLAETLATVALVKLPPEIQGVFVYFVMVFPSGIVLLFFWVLYFKNTALYAPSDFDDQSHYLEANNLKEKVSDQIEMIFHDLNSKGASLSREELERAKISLVKTIDKESLSERANEILDFLKDGSASTMKLAKSLGITGGAAKTTLVRLEEKGLVKREVTGAPGSLQWSLRA